MTQQIKPLSANPSQAGTPVHLFIAGTGAVGGTLIQQLSDLNSGQPFQLMGLCNSRHYLFQPQGISTEQAVDRLSEGKETDWEKLLGKLIRSYQRPAIFVDATGSAQVAGLYTVLMEAGFNIVTPSKLANTADQSYFDRLQNSARTHGVSFRFETTVGAGLPIISTVTDLLDSGDTITEISGVLSGTMTYLFNELEKGIPFSEAVITARELGYAEPDPRDDLSGEDVARKFLTLARITGKNIEREHLKIESLVPQELIHLDRENFLKELSKFDMSWKEKVQKADYKNEKLRYVGTLNEGSVRVEVASVPKDSPIGSLSGTDNLVRISTRRYPESPIVIQGPGAGREVTAAGVLSDIIKITQQL